MRKNHGTLNRYDRVAIFYDLFTELGERLWFSKWRKQFLSPLKGDILEVGIGTGKSIYSYNNGAMVVGIDPSAKMLKKAEERLLRSGKRNITLKQMNVENLEFENDAFDYVVTSCVFCSVQNPIVGLKEIKRVLKSTGRTIMMEHVLSEKTVIALIENLHNPLVKFFTGVNINRDTRQNIINAGFKIIEEENLAFFDVFRLFVATPGK